MQFALGVAPLVLAFHLPAPTAVAPSVSIARVHPSVVQPASTIFPTTEILSYAGQGPTDPAAQAAAMRAKAAKDEGMKAARAAKALERAAKAKEGNERQAAAAAASGLPACPNGVWGTSTNLLTAKSCYRVRDGVIDSKERTGAFLIF